MTHTPSKLRRPSVSQFYRNGTWLFFGVSLVVAGAIAVLALSKTHVTITLKSREVTADVTVAIRSVPSAEDEIMGTFATAAAEETRTIPVTSDGPVVEDFARGTVTIRNEWSQTQALAAGTRLRSNDNNLIYRTTRRVDVPPGGTVAVEVVCDEKGNVGNLEPGRFTIVALWPGLQSQIFGESDTAFAGGTRQAGILTQAALDEAKQSLLADLVKAAAAKLPAAPTGTAYVSEPAVLSSGATTSDRVGSELSSFRLRGVVEIVAVALKAADIQQAATTVVAKSLTEGEAMTSNLEITTSLNANSKTSATVNITGKVQARLSGNNTAFAASAFTHKSAADLLATLRGTPGVAAADVRISPFWASRTPGSASNIRVTILEAE